MSLLLFPWHHRSAALTTDQACHGHGNFFSIPIFGTRTDHPLEDQREVAVSISPVGLTPVPAPSPLLKKPVPWIDKIKWLRGKWDAMAASSSSTNPPPQSLMDDVWRDIVVTNPSDEMTLEDFLFKGSSDPPLHLPADSSDPLPQPSGLMPTSSQLRRKRRSGSSGSFLVEESPVIDKATQQKQRRMIKNRESAARSRERKQAYTAELESLVTKLEEENARLLQEEAELKKERLKQLVKNLIPVVECSRPRRNIMRASSVEW